jgi:PHD/YefM family antitoxin component YafN of YafNO toxin-antitoxin module
MHQHHEQFITDTKGKKRAVILTIKEYEQLLEDMHDLAVIAERRDEEPVSSVDMRKRLSQNGII